MSSGSRLLMDLEFSPLAMMAHERSRRKDADSSRRFRLHAAERPLRAAAAATCAPGFGRQYPKRDWRGIFRLIRPTSKGADLLYSLNMIEAMCCARSRRARVPVKALAQRACLCGKITRHRPTSASAGLRAKPARCS